MNTPPSSDGAAESAAREVAVLQERVASMRSVLTDLLQELMRAESRLEKSRAGQLLEANQQLVITALRAQTDNEAIAHELSEAARLAGLDALTQLPNRMLLLDRLEQAIAHAKRHGTRFALLFLDLDDFKQVNDTRGHAVGDEALKQVAHCLTASIRQADTAGRYGGDEFLILLNEVSHPADAARIADKVLEALAGVSGLGDDALPLRASIGIGVYPDDGQDADTLIQRADAAMYHAKRHGLGRFAYIGEAG